MDLPNRGKSPSRAKLCAAVVGGSAVVAMAALGVAIDQGSDADTVAKSSSMQVGVTSTQTTPSGAPATGAAQPGIKGPAPLPSEEEAAK